MKGALVLTLTNLLLVASVRCYDGIGKELIKQHLEDRIFKRSVHYVTENLGEEYSPVYYVGPQDGLKAADKITKWPGQPNGMAFDQYSGYVTVDPKAGRALFYYFTESQKSSTKPLVLWLNGGPGCSSLGAGAMTELGPFRVSEDNKTLWQNPYAWNTAANVIFLESPSGVGFSYSNRSSDYTTGDKKTAADSYTFLVNWLETFPEYKSRDFFLTGESYAGHYVPQLAQLILRNNKITNQTVINLKGIAIGNAYVDLETLSQGRYDFLWTHALISDEIHQGIVSNCNFSDPKIISLGASCKAYLRQANVATGVIDHYNIYAPLCSSSSSPLTAHSIFEFDPCSDNYVVSYLNKPNVRQAIHAYHTGAAEGWLPCSPSLSWLDQPNTVLPVIKELTKSGIRVWLFSGDTDSVVPVTDTRHALTKMGLPVKTPWYPWYYSQDEVGGYAVEYENLTFVTVRGSGHFVPSYQPARALAVFSSFLEGKLPPSPVYNNIYI